MPCSGPLLRVHRSPGHRWNGASMVAERWQLRQRPTVHPIVPLHTVCDCQRVLASRTSHIQMRRTGRTFPSLPATPPSMLRSAGAGHRFERLGELPDRARTTGRNPAHRRYPFTGMPAPSANRPAAALQAPWVFVNSSRSRSWPPTGRKTGANDQSVLAEKKQRPKRGIHMTPAVCCQAPPTQNSRLRRPNEASSRPVRPGLGPSAGPWGPGADAFSRALRRLGGYRNTALRARSHRGRKNTRTRPSPAPRSCGATPARWRWRPWPGAGAAP